MEKVKSGAREAAARVIKELETADVFSIAEACGLRVVYESWFPVTFGEFDRRRKTIVVNLSAPESRVLIIAHELGHYFARDLNLTNAEQETFAHAFAERLTADEN
ncbi:MAG TPA: ImmA/IrrE family metallo-endopeptidase [Pyrinomonadaceae bacterium]|jgi:Zn-dependent peptidase ImmA (M78 family)